MPFNFRIMDVKPGMCDNQEKQQYSNDASQDDAGFLDGKVL
jgi:hypothetical protein